MMRLLWLMIAGGAGAAARYGMTLLVQQWLATGFARHLSPVIFSPHFPLGTLLINVLGSFLLAFLTVFSLAGTISPELRLILGTGFLGAFTTFSTFELEAHGLLASGAWMQAALYILGNLLLGFVAVVLGGLLALRLMGR